MEPLLSNDNNRINANSAVKKSKYYYYRNLILIITLYVIFLILDGAIGGVLFKKYEEIYSQYLNQSTAFVYIIVSRVCMLAINNFSAKHDVSEEQQKVEEGLKEENKLVLGAKQTPFYLLAIVGTINGTSNVFMGIGMPNTALLSQSLLGLLGLPVVIVLSYFFLNVKGTREKYFGAIIILLGTTLSSLHTVIHKGSKSNVGNPIYWYSTLFFALGNMGLGIERVVEDFLFKKYSNLHPMKMFMNTMYVQFE